jgi:phage-related protein
MEEVTTNNNNINRRKGNAIWDAYSWTMQEGLKTANKMWRVTLDISEEETRDR